MNPKWRIKDGKDTDLHVNSVMMRSTKTLKILFLFQFFLLCSLSFTAVLVDDDDSVTLSRGTSAAVSFHLPGTLCSPSQRSASRRVEQ